MSEKDIFKDRVERELSSLNKIIKLKISIQEIGLKTNHYEDQIKKISIDTNQYEDQIEEIWIDTNQDEDQIKKQLRIGDKTKSK